MGNTKYYWLKLKKDFFKRHDIKIIESMPNGKDYILFYLKMLLESIDHDGNLRFNDTIPYNENMLSVVTNTNIDLVRNAMKVFIELKMIEICEDSTIYMIEVNKMLGSETAVAERVRKSREKKQLLLQSNNDETKCNTEIEIDKELEKDIDKIQSIWIRTFGRNPKPLEVLATERIIKRFGSDQIYTIMRKGVEANFNSIFTLEKNLDGQGNIKPKTDLKQGRTVEHNPA